MTETPGTESTPAAAAPDAASAAVPEEAPPPADAGATGPQPHADNPIVQAVAPGYAFEETSLELGGLMLDADTLCDTKVRIPLAMLNRHGLVAGATGTGKTKTLQLLAEQLSANGVPVRGAAS